MSGSISWMDTAEVTQLLKLWHHGAGAFDRLLPLVYDELRHIAVAYIGRERPGHFARVWLHRRMADS